MRSARQLSIGICMLDWPEQNHTSPMRTSWIVVVVVASVMVSVCFLKPAFGVRISTDQLPWASAWACCAVTLQEGLTVTVAPGAALPQTGTLHCCWSTIWSVNRGLSCTWAAAGAAKASRAARAIIAVRMYRLILSYIYFIVYQTATNSSIVREPSIVNRMSE